MKFLRFSIFFFLSFLYLINSSAAFALNFEVNPIWDPVLKAYKSGNTGLTGADQPLNEVTNNSTTVTLRISGPELHVGDCYLIGSGTVYGTETNFPSFFTGDGRNTKSSTISFYTMGNDPWSDKTKKGLWNDKFFASQAGGGDNLCGFVTGDIDGSGPDNGANYVRAKPNSAGDGGEIWLYNLCENMEGIRNDCQTKFTLNKKYSFTVFHVTCFIQLHGINLDQDSHDNDGISGGGHLPDPNCNINLARIKNGVRTLRIWGADSKDGFAENWLSFNFTDEDCNTTSQFPTCTADGFTPIPTCGGCFFTPNSDYKKSSSQFQINSNTVNTEFGQIPRDPAELATVVLRIALGVAGGIAFLLMAFGSFRLIFSAGSPESVQQGREIITAAVIGLLVIIFSTFILQLIGISILGLPL